MHKTYNNNGFQTAYKPSNLVSVIRLNEKYDLPRKSLWKHKHFGSFIYLF